MTVWGNLYGICVFLSYKIQLFLSYKNVWKNGCRRVFMRFSSSVYKKRMSTCFFLIVWFSHPFAGQQKNRKSPDRKKYQETHTIYQQDFKFCPFVWSPPWPRRERFKKLASIQGGSRCLSCVFSWAVSGLPPSPKFNIYHTKSEGSYNILTKHKIPGSKKVPRNAHNLSTGFQILSVCVVPSMATSRKI